MVVENTCRSKICYYTTQAIWASRDSAWSILLYFKCRQKTMSIHDTYTYVELHLFQGQQIVAGLPGELPWRECVWELPGALLLAVCPIARVKAFVRAPTFTVTVGGLLVDIATCSLGLPAAIVHDSQSLFSMHVQSPPLDSSYAACINLVQYLYKYLVQYL